MMVGTVWRYIVERVSGKVLYVSTTDYGWLNKHHPRWAVWQYRDSGWPFRIRVAPKRVSPYFWTEVEALVELDLMRFREDSVGVLALFITILVGAMILLWLAVR